MNTLRLRKIAAEILDELAPDLSPRLRRAFVTELATSTALNDVDTSDDGKCQYAMTTHLGNTISRMDISIRKP